MMVLVALLVSGLALPPGTAAVPDEDAVQLKNGRILAGAVKVDPANPDGFTVERWDPEGTVFVRWSQISAAERARLTGKGAEARPQGLLVDGVRAMTAGRDVVGVLVKEDALLLYIKTRDSKVPVQVPKSALLRPHEVVKIAEAEAYSSEERVDSRATKANEKDYGAMMDLGKFAASVGLYERAKEFYLKAAAADPSKKDETDAVLARNESLIKEGRASVLLDQVKEMIRDTEFVKATELAKKLLSEFPDTEIAKQSKDLPVQIGKKAKDYENKRTEYLADEVPQAYKDRRSALLGQYGSTKYKIAEALSLATKIDEAVVAELAKRMKATPEEIQAAWVKREPKPRTVTYGDGSWIVKGGQDGGLDTDAKTQPNQNNTNRSTGGFGFGGKGGTARGRSTGGTPAQPQPLGKKLETKDGWWASSSSSERRNFIEAEYAKNSGAVKKEVKTKKCAVCGGDGVHKETRSGVAVEAKCLRCHGAKEDEIVTYE